MKLSAALVLFITSHLLHAAEMRSFSLSDLTDGTRLPKESGIPYSLPKSIIRVEVQLYVEKQAVLKGTKQGGGYRLDRSSPIYVVRAESTSNQVATVSFADDEDLKFYLTSTGGLLTDVSNLSVEYYSNSLRLSKVGVQYSDKTAEFIQGTVKLLGETAGMVLSGMTPFAAEDAAAIVVRERVDGLTRTAVWTIDNVQATQTTAGELDVVQEQLKRDLVAKLTGSGLPQNVTLHTLQIQAITAAQANPSPASLLANGSTVGGKKYVPGVIYRNPGPSLLTVFSIEKEIDLSTPANQINKSREIAKYQTRLPEAGHAAWIELSSKVFRTVTPNVEFNEDGSLKTFTYAGAAKLTEIQAALTQMTTSANAVLNQIKTNALVASTEEDAKAQIDAQNEYELAKLKAEKVQLETEITALADKITNTQDPAAKEQATTTRITKTYQLSLVSKQLEIFERDKIKVQK